MDYYRSQGSNEQTDAFQQINKAYVSDNGLHPVPGQAAHLERLITYFLTYVGAINKLAPLKFCHLGWYRYFVWPIDYLF